MDVNLIEYLIQNYDPRLLEMLTGKLLGDGNILIEKNKSPRFRFGHARKDRLWCLTSYQSLGEHIKLSPPKFRRVFDDRLVAGHSDLYYVQSTVDNLYVLLKKIWYPNGVKKVPFHLIKWVLSPLCLAWWYQDDGNLKINKNNPEKIVISTESFSIEEIKFLKGLIQEKYNVLFIIDGKKRLVLYDKPSILYFLSIIRPYIVIKRKDMFQNNIDPTIFPPHHRTSLYISSELSFEMPTSDIKLILHTMINEINKNININDVYNFYINNLRNGNKQTNSYQIEFNREELCYLAFFQSSTGFTKGESIEYFEYLRTSKVN
ncbi:hypothetical protein [Bacillus sp. REN16]|uniref:hypothetical protein n=1 Tax=Bacillus sp. REN16 TaxID=2887296 RepID=UPI001E614421|nr:hypothetical protein [Bacillus sp. REN16]MCC3356946.1 hypothetical protein [Bacillus sp. REN16]